jgi:hypothetical protein
VKRVSLVMVLLLASAALLSSSDSLAQARRPQTSAQKKIDGAVQTVDAAARAKKLAELEMWLQRLVGHFRIEGTTKLFYGTSTICPEGGFCYMHRNSTGAGDCVRVAAGHGIHCVIKTAWPRFIPRPPEFAPSEVNWPGPFLDNAVVLFGIDPENMGIRFLLVDAKSIAYEAFGPLTGDSVTFRSGCGKDPASKRCKRIFSIRATSDGTRLEMGLEVRSAIFTRAGYLFSLHRLPAEQ